jgi:hypothetical protein
MRPAIRALQLPDDEKPLLVDPKPPREVEELEPDELDDVPTRLAEVLLLELLVLDLLLLELLVLELLGLLPQEPLRRRHGSCCAGAAGVAAFGGCAAACWLGGRHSALRAGIM